MIKEIIAAGKDVLEAKENARIALGAGPLDDVNFEIVHAGSRGIFGIIGVKPAQVKAWIELPDTQERKHRAPRPERTENKPEGEKNQENVNNGGQQKAEHRKNNKKKKKKPQQNSQPKAQKPQQNKPAVADSVPEEEMTMTLREVGAGEDMSYDFVTGLISDIGLSAEAKLYALEDGTRRIIISGDDAAVLIGHHGDTLDALQYLANLACARKNIRGERDKSRVTIDIEGYRKKREETLRALARRMAAKAKRNGRSVMLEPMSAYERRIIHSEIQNIEGVSTNSIGSDNNRKIVIYLTDKKPEGLFEKAPETPLVEEFAKDENDELLSNILGNFDAYTDTDNVEDASDILVVKTTGYEENESEEN